MVGFEPTVFALSEHCSYQTELHEYIILVECVRKTSCIPDRFLTEITVK